MRITSTAFQNNESIPSEYTCDGKNCNPPLVFSEVPKNTQSLVLIVEDPDAPSKVFVHWLVYNIPPTTSQILKNQVPANSMLGMTDIGKSEYVGPCPPNGTHRYFFKLFALDSVLDLAKGASKEEVEEAMKEHVIESAELVGLYARR